MWAEEKVKEKADIARIAAEDREKAEYEATERGKAWDEAKAKENSEISRLAAKASEKAKSEAEERARETMRVRENDAKSAVEEAATDTRSGAESEGAEIERA